MFYFYYAAVMRNYCIYERTQNLIIKMADAANELEGDGKFVQLLVRTRLDMEEDFISGKKRNSDLWGCIFDKVKEAYPNFQGSKEQISRKFVNLKITYNRIKQRIKETGLGTTRWSFFDDFDEVYGTRHSIDSPAHNLVNSFDDTLNESIFQSYKQSHSSEDGSPVPKRKRGNDEILQYLREESRKEQKRHEETLQMEERKLQMEQKRINAILELKEILKKALLKN